MSNVKTDAELSAELDEIAKKYVPKFKVISKEDSWFHRTIGFIFRAYFTRYWTTIGYTAAHPPGRKHNWTTKIHEIQHARQSKKYTRVGMGLLYLLPQILALLFILPAIFVSWWFLFGLLFLLPLPAYFRMKFELEAYQLSVMVDYWLGRNTDYTIDHYTHQFVSLAYYVMWPFKSYVRGNLNAAWLLARFWDEVKDKDPYANDVYLMMKNGGRVK